MTLNNLILRRAEGLGLRVEGSREPSAFVLPTQTLSDPHSPALCRWTLCAKSGRGVSGANPC